MEENNSNKYDLTERLKIRYLNLRNNITYYSMNDCIGDYIKIGLTEKEIECIKNRSYTYLLTYRLFNINQKDNLIN
jgi:hypothetical protein